MIKIKKNLSEKNSDELCSFCKPEVKETQEILRTKYSRLIYPQAPMIPENVMIVPIRHVELVEDLSEEEIVGIFKLAKKVYQYFQKKNKITAFNLFVNSGKAAGQHVPHVHFHFFGRSEKEKISPYKKMNNSALYPVEKLSEEKLKKEVEKMRQEIMKYK